MLKLKNEQKKFGYFCVYFRCCWKLLWKLPIFSWLKYPVMYIHAKCMDFHLNGLHKHSVLHTQQYTFTCLAACYFKCFAGIFVKYFCLTYSWNAFLFLLSKFKRHEYSALLVVWKIAKLMKSFFWVIQLLINAKSYAVAEQRFFGPNNIFVWVKCTKEIFGIFHSKA